MFYIHLFDRKVNEESLSEQFIAERSKHSLNMNILLHFCTPCFSLKFVFIILGLSPETYGEAILLPHFVTCAHFVGILFPLLVTCYHFVTVFDKMLPGYLRIWGPCKDLRT